MFKFGRKRPAPYRRLHFGSYATTDLPAPPPSVQYDTKALASLKNIYGNDQLGDCTCAGVGHGIGIWRGDAGNNDPAPTADQVIDFYCAACGYVRGDQSTDRGGDEVTVLNYWRNNGFFADGSGKIATWCNVDGTNPTQIKQAIWLTGFVYFGVELPDEWVNPMPSKNGFVWDVAGDPNPEQGHCFISGAYSAGSKGVIIDTWGLFGLMPWDAIAKYAVPSAGGELHAAFSQDAINRATQKAPNGFDFEQLLADQDAL